MDVEMGENKNKTKQRPHDFLNLKCRVLISYKALLMDFLLSEKRQIPYEYNYTKLATHRLSFEYKMYNNHSYRTKSH